MNCSVCSDLLQVHPSLLNDQLKTVLENRNSNGASPLNSGKLLELIANSSNPLDVPICRICCNSISEDLSKQLTELDKEYIEYKNVYESLLEQKESNKMDEQTAKRKLDELTREESELMDELNGLLKSERELTQELKDKQDEQKKMLEKDEELYRKLRDNHRTLSEQSAELRSLKTQVNYAQEQLEKLLKTNVLDMAFFIWKDGEYGTINGLRLGRLPADNVDWHEINAAFGQVAMLMVVMCRHVSLKLENYEIVPFGSHSIIRHLKGSKVEEYQLYGSGSWRPFGLSTLDHGIVAFVDCFCQLENKLKENFPKAERILPYRMVKDKIIDQESQYLVKMQLNSEERWTKAMKCLLLNMKRVVGILANNRITLESPKANGTE
ncbi:unnamed protein product [Bursaphelenchus xylophilus]|uniref:(pine wood nematode) hypothetical protein n=1 Tax=Bursaphelenchus xylophilus TaxID=6326 RepID=A0A1I7RHK6_BURXY|nr:unnamed protein product [Bursaphelenchus xylophilus]CAG9115642.1 unnamed protein product [Bursaphelenchus xylophilus]